MKDAPQIIEITPESHPEIWEILQPPATEQTQQQATESAQ
jgi:hypothetical protein